MRSDVVALYVDARGPYPKLVGGGGAVPPGIKVCSAQQRRRTPIAFAEWPLDLAATARPQRSAA